jgi:hypothetical protein
MFGVVSRAKETVANLVQEAFAFRSSVFGLVLSIATCVSGIMLCGLCLTCYIIFGILCTAPQ